MTTIKKSIGKKKVTTGPASRSQVMPGDQDMLTMYRHMILMREFEDLIIHLYQQGKMIGGAYSGRGNEATAVGSAFALRANDAVFPMHRDLGAHFVKGQSVRAMMLTYLGRASGLTRGRDGTGHYTDTRLGIYGNISHLGAMIPVACGVALASNIRKENNVVMTYIGDGGASVGEVHEGLMMASVMHLPLILIIENNKYAYSTPVGKQVRAGKLSDRAVGYGIPGVTIDGTDILEVYRVCRQAAERARNGQGPTLIESVTMRMAGHAAHDNAWYVPKEMLERWKKKDPVEIFEKVLMKKGLLTPASRVHVIEETRSLVEAEAAYALDQPYPSGDEVEIGVTAE
jgi:TPP-dependent pyruvate/acetoin dehydrogenase alpha subunit